MNEDNTKICELINCAIEQIEQRLADGKPVSIVTSENGCEETLEGKDLVDALKSVVAWYQGGENPPPSAKLAAMAFAFNVKQGRTKSEDKI